MNRVAMLLAVCAVLAALFAGCIGKPEQVDQLGFEQAIIKDARAKYPAADIIEIEGHEEVGGTNITSVRVTFNYTSVCPVRMRLKYKYPDYGYETGVTSYIIRDCTYKCEGNCIITGEEEAIVAAHTLSGSQEASQFIGDGTGIRAKAEKAGDNWQVTFTNADGKSLVVVVRAREPAIVSVSLPE
ncbi:MAG: hypothetical protein N3H30_01840 [Candidatus Micrarchaeota archaeon]|nr:hypothetical protein [Candidatus Micrarchaeota archaeon]